MLDTFTIRQTDMPDEMRVLLNRYPRESWDAHPGFKEKTQHWLGAHQMFRHVSERVRLDAESVLNKDMAMDAYAERLNHYGGSLVGHLIGHHGWEDYSYFPELSAADPRFDEGLDLLEKDHADLDRVLESFTRTANRVMYLATADEHQACEEVGRLYPQSQVIEAFLKRHLTDEEDLAVPIILHHRLRG